MVFQGVGYQRIWYEVAKWFLFALLHNVGEIIKLQFSFWKCWVWYTDLADVWPFCSILLTSNSLVNLVVVVLVVVVVVWRRLLPYYDQHASGYLSVDSQILSYWFFMVFSWFRFLIISCSCSNYLLPSDVHTSYIALVRFRFYVWMVKWTGLKIQEFFFYWYCPWEGPSPFPRLG